jgi:hypothetical protein
VSSVVTVILSDHIVSVVSRKWEGKILLLTEDTKKPYELSSAQPIHQTEFEPNVFDAIESEQ